MPSLCHNPRRQATQSTSAGPTAATAGAAATYTHGVRYKQTVVVVERAVDGHDVTEPRLRREWAAIVRAAGADEAKAVGHLEQALAILGAAHTDG